MLYLEKMKMHTITSGNYVTSVHGMVHPNRIIGEHDFLYILRSEEHTSELQSR